MSGAVGSVESPEVYPRAISRTPQQFVNASHPAGCRTLFRAPGGSPDAAGTGHVAVGYYGETRAFGRAMARPVLRALRGGAYHVSGSNGLSDTDRFGCGPGFCGRSAPGASS